MRLAAGIGYKSLPCNVGVRWRIVRAPALLQRATIPMGRHGLGVAQRLSTLNERAGGAGSLIRTPTRRHVRSVARLSKSTTTRRSLRRSSPTTPKSTTSASDAGIEAAGWRRTHTNARRHPPPRGRPDERRCPPRGVHRALRDGLGCTRQSGARCVVRIGTRVRCRGPH
jgi:hypothetical protein